MKVALLESRCSFFPPDFIKIRSVVLVGIVVFVGMVVFVGFMLFALLLLSLLQMRILLLLFKLQNKTS